MKENHHVKNKHRTPKKPNKSPHFLQPRTSAGELARNARSRMKALRHSTPPAATCVVKQDDGSEIARFDLTAEMEGRLAAAVEATGLSAQQIFRQAVERAVGNCAGKASAPEHPAWRLGTHWVKMAFTENQFAALSALAKVYGYRDGSIVQSAWWIVMFGLDCLPALEARAAQLARYAQAEGFESSLHVIDGRIRKLAENLNGALQKRTRRKPGS